MTAVDLYADLVARFRGRVQTAGYWVPWGNYELMVVSYGDDAGLEWFVSCGNRIVGTGYEATTPGAWWAACAATAADVAAVESEQVA